MPAGIFPDAALARHFIRRGRPQTPEELSTVTGIMINGSDEKIADLSGLERLTWMDFVAIRDNDVADLAPLGKMRGLKWLYLPGNRIEDLSPLSELPGLLALDLSRNRVRDVSALFGLTGPEALYLEGNSVGEADFRALKERLIPLGLRPLGPRSLEKPRVLKNEAAGRAWLVAHGDDGRLVERLRLCIDALRHRDDNGLSGWDARVLAVTPYGGGAREMIRRTVREARAEERDVFTVRSDTVYAVSIDDEPLFEPLSDK